MKPAKTLCFIIVIILTLTSCSNKKAEPSNSPSPTPIPYAKLDDIKDADAALKRLEDGNMNFLLGDRNSANIGKDVRIPLAENGQAPYAVVLTCSDSQVSPELVFDTGVGEISVIRTAGNVVSDFELGSIEYAVNVLKTPLIVVMGHTTCTAVAQTIAGNKEGNIKKITDEISLALKDAEEYKGQEEYQGMVEDINITIALDKISKDPNIKELIKNKKVKLVGCKYSTKVGRVMFNWT